MAYLKSFIKRAPLVVREYIPSFGNNITLFAVFSFAQKFSQNSKNFGACKNRRFLRLWSFASQTSKIYDFRKLRIFGVWKSKIFTHPKRCIWGFFKDKIDIFRIFYYCYNARHIKHTLMWYILFNSIKYMLFSINYRN
jgi:hypothetical protein